jgi:hypothetical protein
MCIILLIIVSFTYFFIFYLFSSDFRQEIKWIHSDGEIALTKYAELALECADVIRNEEQEFEKFYFISMVSY